MDHFVNSSVLEEEAGVDSISVNLSALSPETTEFPTVYSYSVEASSANDTLQVFSDGLTTSEDISETLPKVTTSVLEKIKAVTESVVSSTTGIVINITSPALGTHNSDFIQEGAIMAPNVTLSSNGTETSPFFPMASSTTPRNLGIPNTTEMPAVDVKMMNPSSIHNMGQYPDYKHSLLFNATLEGQGVDQEFFNRMNQFLRGIRGPEFMSLNNTLCQSYLPTLEETPEAMGTLGIVLWILGSVITLILIFLMAKHLYFIYRTAHKSFRMHIFYCNSVFMVMALLTSIGTAVPRAHGICSALKDIYMCIGLAHFVDLTIAMYGGENAMAHYVKDRVISVMKLPFFCCCLCVPKCEPTKKAIKILKWLIWQMKWSQAAYYLLRTTLVFSMQNSLGMVPGDASFAYLIPINLLSFLPGVGAVFLIGSLVIEDLQGKYGYSLKEKLARLTILTTKLQRILFDILEVAGVFPCYPPFVSSKFYKNVLKDFIYLVEVLILGILSFKAYSARGEFERGTSNEITRKNFSRGQYQEQDDNGYRDALSKKVAELPESPC